MRSHKLGKRLPGMTVSPIAVRALVINPETDVLTTVVISNVGFLILLILGII